MVFFQSQYKLLHDGACAIAESLSSPRQDMPLPPGSRPASTFTSTGDTGSRTSTQEILRSSKRKSDRQSRQISDRASQVSARSSWRPEGKDSTPTSKRISENSLDSNTASPRSSYRTSMISNNLDTLKQGSEVTAVQYYTQVE